MTCDLAVPVEEVPVSFVLHDGRRCVGVVFLPFGEDCAGLLDREAPFVSVRESGGWRLYSRSAVACATLGPQHAIRVREAAGELRQWHRQVTVRLRSGVVVRGELQAAALPGGSRTSDWLNDASRSFVLHAGPHVVLVAKAHVECVEES